ncbi:MAG: hypothetical protein COT73_03355 [Bdellovibrio sp. CG10_big_fil_rev_8_21_14_0_10_47_8]|nr:MAG: hypothetical protein COT73_03355 [Bdellovibrio sp. CG10_big_fil_rev_8_21_14_0_10_47_8]
MKMKSMMSVFIAVVSLAACSSNPHKAESIDTSLEKDEVVTGDTSVGVKDGNMVVQTKVKMNEELRKLQNEVYTLEDRVYGNRTYGSQGLYGVLRKCRMDIADKKNGGDGKLMWTEPIDRVTSKEEVYKIGIDGQDKLVGVSDEFLKDRIQRFRGYRNVLEKRQDEYDEKLAICQADLKARQYDQQKAAVPSNNN